MDDRHPYGVIGGSSGPGTLHATTHRIGASVVIALAGEMDLLTEPTAAAALDDALAQLPEPARSGPAHLDGAEPDHAQMDGTVTLLIIDLTEVTFLSSKGLQLLLTADRAAAERGVALRLATGTHHSVLRPLQISGLDTTLPVRRTLDEALDGHAQRATDPPRIR